MIDAATNNPLLTDLFSSLSVEAELLINDTADDVVKTSSQLPAIRITGLSGDSRHLLSLIHI